MTDFGRNILPAAVFPVTRVACEVQLGFDQRCLRFETGPNLVPLPALASDLWQRSSVVKETVGKDLDFLGPLPFPVAMRHTQADTERSRSTRQPIRLLER